MILGRQFIPLDSFGVHKLEARDLPHELLAAVVGVVEAAQEGGFENFGLRQRAVIPSVRDEGIKDSNLVVLGPGPLEERSGLLWREVNRWEFNWKPRETPKHLSFEIIESFHP
jgi:hypothetical protein